MPLTFDDIRKYADFKTAANNALAVPILAAGADILTGNNKPWEYYAGLALGSAAVGTGIPGAAMTVYAIAEILDLTLFHSPEGGQVDIFIDGIAAASIDAYAVNTAWETFQVTLDGARQQRVDVVNTSASLSSGLNWSYLAIGPLTLTHTLTDPVLVPHGRSEMTNTTIISFGVRDADGDNTSIPVFVDGTVAIDKVMGYATGLATLLDGAIDGKITGMTIQLAVALPGGLKTDPVANSEVERGANLNFSCEGTRYSHTLRLPAFKAANFAGDTVNAANITALLTALTDGVDVSGTTVKSTDAYANPLSVYVKGVKTFRRK